MFAIRQLCGLAPGAGRYGVAAGRITPMWLPANFEHVRQPRHFPAKILSIFVVLRQRPQAPVPAEPLHVSKHRPGASPEPQWMARCRMPCGVMTPTAAPG